MSDLYRLLALCPANTEDIVQSEIAGCGGNFIRSSKGRVEFEGDLSVVYRVCLSARVVNRLLLKIHECEVADPDDLYRQAHSIDWGRFFSGKNSILIGSNVFDVSRVGFNNTNFAVMKVKDAICDFFREKEGTRPDIDKDSPDIRLFFELLRTTAGFYIDLSGGSLHQRGYRQQAVEAPLKETLAAALLYRANWKELCKDGGTFIDMFCGSGTLLVEAALIAFGYGPGLLRSHFGFEFWKDHSAEIYRQIRGEVEALISYTDNIFIGSDLDPRAIDIARKNLERAGVSDYVRLFVADATTVSSEFFSKKIGKELPQGLIVTNPPYGERLSDFDSALQLYSNLGQQVVAGFDGWGFSLFTSNHELSMKIPLKPHKVNNLLNGKIECFLANFRIDSEKARKPHDEDAISPGMEMLINRIKKNLKQMKKWRTKNQISCFRCYDADLPEYSAFIEVYKTLDGQMHLVVSEYAPPAEIPESKRSRRLSEIIRSVGVVFADDNPVVHLRTRAKQKGRSQYVRRDLKNEFFWIEEGGLKFKVNFDDFLDTGIFLDHRPARNIIREFAREIKEAGEKCFFLNLFAYTGSASLYAASEGAVTVTVDKSRTYLNWAKENMVENGFDDSFHRYVQEDCFDFLGMTTDRFDLIFLDPPTFSNTKSENKVFDVQNDHVRIIKAATSKLRDGGLLIFSNNFRKFKMDYESLADLQIVDITPKTIDMDFQRDQKIHQCYLIQKRD
ncbi:MAG: bifunctional 23S rRNA (guanine(2069)-N(7))-methyltransferase RlmK/23S rRNA (guanine(2445)-N(2))-methyltransferase RlmL [Spirochaetales bacterium]|nr:bifunctional 23S rRNA (guanine(2069)-N(7))-methyltransferase RlmK/23S rRNA (guanine(2445)-N(2))-methyltransferase RlmL [Spirochaetales bacterium]